MSDEPTIDGQGTLPRAWFHAEISEFLVRDSASILGQLTKYSDRDVVGPQIEAWLVEISLLKRELNGIRGFLFLEFNIPRMGRRVDAIVITGSAVFVIEFKVGEKLFQRAAIGQAWDYALDLKNFHAASHAAPIVPVVVATESSNSERAEPRFASDGVCAPLCVGPSNLGRVINELANLPGKEEISVKEWSSAPYRPHPTIIEAARVLYAQHSVAEIARHDAGAQNLQSTSARIEALVDEAKSKGRKIICFVTGVPGAGKTLVGLNLATQRREADKPTHAVFLSGNGPLVAVLERSLDSR